MGSGLEVPFEAATGAEEGTDDWEITGITADEWWWHPPAHDETVTTEVALSYNTVAVLKMVEVGMGVDELVNNEVVELTSADDELGTTEDEEVVGTGVDEVVGSTAIVEVATASTVEEVSLMMMEPEIMVT